MGILGWQLIEHSMVYDPVSMDRVGAYLAAVALIRAYGIDVEFTAEDRVCPGYEIAAQIILEDQTQDHDPVAEGAVRRPRADGR